MEIDESLYSRQLYVLGHKAMAAMSTSNILILGCGASGVEIAKNIILMGVKAVSLFDPHPTEWRDLSGQFYLTPEDVGLPRAARSHAKLAALNEYVTVSVLSEPNVDEAVIKRFQVVVCADQLHSENLRISRLCRANGVKFIAAEGKGLFCRVFCDFGEKHIVTDVDGELPVSLAVAGITSEGVVTVFDEKRHGMETGDHVTFSEVEGLPQLNGCAPVPITVTGPFSFTIDKALVNPFAGAGGSGYKNGGWVTQVKMPVTLSFKSYESFFPSQQPPVTPLSIGEDVVISDFSKMDQVQPLHAAYLALHQWMEAKGHNKGPHAQDEASIEEILKVVDVSCESRKQASSFL
jgi:ubiquitin-activating enzyme E1